MGVIGSHQGRANQHTVIAEARDTGGVLSRRDPRLGNLDRAAWKVGDECLKSIRVLMERRQVAAVQPEHDLIPALNSATRAVQVARIERLKQNRESHFSAGIKHRTKLGIVKNPRDEQHRGCAPTSCFDNLVWIDKKVLPHHGDVELACNGTEVLAAPSEA